MKEGKTLMENEARRGHRYMTDEEQAAFDVMISPHIFDPDTVKNKVLDIQYGTLPEQKLDLYLPDESAAEPLPVIFDVHGGGWCVGNKREGFLDGIIGAIRHGYAVIAPDYRLAPGIMYPENLYDVKTAVRWARAHAKEYGLDPDRFAMIGDSAGGHLTLAAAYTAGHPELAGTQYGWADQPDHLNVICDMFGVSILDDFQDRFFEESGVVRAKFGGSTADLTPLVFGTDKNLLKIISPISYVSKEIPPTLILQGKIDSIVPYQQATLLYERICEVCGEGRAELLLYEDRNHEDYAFYADDALCKTVLPFFDRYLK